MTDQQLGGLMLWVPGDMMSIVAAGIVMIMWYRRARRGSASSRGPGKKETDQRRIRSPPTEGACMKNGSGRGALQLVHTHETATAAGRGTMRAERPPDFDYLRNVVEDG